MDKDQLECIMKLNLTDFYFRLIIDLYLFSKGLMRNVVRKYNGNNKYFLEVLFGFHGNYKIGNEIIMLESKDKYDTKESVGYVIASSTFEHMVNIPVEVVDIIKKKMNNRNNRIKKDSIDSLFPAEIVVFKTDEYKSFPKTEMPQIKRYVESKYKVTGNPLERLLEKYPDKPWDWEKISSNIGITRDFIEKHPTKKWDWNYISRNPSITMEIIEKYPDKPWDWEWISMNPNITMEMIEKYPDKPWEWAHISHNPNLTTDMIEKYPNKPWNWSWISSNIHITMDMLEKYHMKPWDWYGISMNPNITMEMIENNLNKPWDWEWLSMNPNITMEMIKKYSNKPWNWSFISQNSNITMEMIEKYPNKPWDWEWDYISVNPNITMEMIEKYPNKPWVWENISENPNLTIEMIEKNPDKPWNWGWISSNRFLYDGTVCRREMFKDMKLKQKQASQIIYSDSTLPMDLINIISDFISYD